MDKAKLEELEEITYAQYRELLDFVNQGIEKGDLGYRVANPEVKQKMLDILEEHLDRIMSTEAKYAQLRQKYKYDNPEKLSKIVQYWYDYVNNYDRMLRDRDINQNEKSSIVEVEKLFNEMLSD